MSDKEEVERLIEESREEWAHSAGQNDYVSNFCKTIEMSLDPNWEIVLENGRYVWRKKE